jgi:hypothetical protein
MGDEDRRAERLLAAQDKAAALFAEVADRGLVAAGQGERVVSDRIRDLANEMFGTTPLRRTDRAGRHGSDCRGAY